MRLAWRTPPADSWGSASCLPLRHLEERALRELGRREREARGKGREEEKEAGNVPLQDFSKEVPTPHKLGTCSAMCRFEDLQSFLRTPGNHPASAHIRETEAKEGKKLA